MSDASMPANAGSSKSKVLLFILIGLLAAGAAAGGTWYFVKNQYEGGEYAPVNKKKPTTFVKLEAFTVNLQPEQDNSRYLQVEFSIKAYDTEVIDVIDRQKPEIRNKILLLLSSKKPSEINTLTGKEQLSQEIIQAIQAVIDAEHLQEDILDVLFTSFIIQ